MKKKILVMLRKITKNSESISISQFVFFAESTQDKPQGVVKLGLGWSIKLCSWTSKELDN